MENDNSTFVRIVVQLDYDHRGERDRTNPIIFDLYDHLQALIEKYEGLSLTVLGYADIDEQSHSLVAVRGNETEGSVEGGSDDELRERACG